MRMKKRKEAQDNMMTLPKLGELRVGFIQNLAESFAVRREHRNAGPNVVGYRDGLKQKYELKMSQHFFYFF